jgi:hypothetical protein
MITYPYISYSHFRLPLLGFYGPPTKIILGGSKAIEIMQSSREYSLI